ncbi:aldose epimerase family protein [Cronobacter sakazakii]|uniref:aldose epimerase family protein n=1 Tax=Cronobacter sakazakii TaxID=28141 RepID=UPI000CFD1ADA|nr:hypothetical protein [Cronobacter sakazakii]
MNWTLENSRFRLEIAPVGAELCHWWDAWCQRDWIWQPHADVWMHSATQLFPVVGRLLHGGLRDNGAFYPLPDHGFLRHRPFNCLAQQSDRLHLICEADDMTMAVWPFRWRLHIIWTLNDSGLAIRWRGKIQTNSRLAFLLAGIRDLRYLLRASRAGLLSSMDACAGRLWR